MPRKVSSRKKSPTANLRVCHAHPPANRKRNEEIRSREYLMESEVEAVLKAAQSVGRYPLRDATAILMAFRHGLRPGEMCALPWDNVLFKDQRVHIKRLKNGISGPHRLGARELSMLRKLKRERRGNSPYVFATERGGAMSTRTFHDIVVRAGKLAGLTFPIHPHMLRHSCGYHARTKGLDIRELQSYLGHRDMQSTAIYASLDAEKEVTLWDD